MQNSVDLFGYKVSSGIGAFESSWWPWFVLSCFNFELQKLDLTWVRGKVKYSSWPPSRSQKSSFSSPSSMSSMSSTETFSANFCQKVHKSSKFSLKSFRGTFPGGLLFLYRYHLYPTKHKQRSHSQMAHHRLLLPRMCRLSSNSQPWPPLHTLWLD